MKKVSGMVVPLLREEPYFLQLLLGVGAGVVVGLAGKGVLHPATMLLAWLAWSVNAQRVWFRYNNSKGVSALNKSFGCVLISFALAVICMLFVSRV